MIRDHTHPANAEWLEADGRGGYAMGTSGAIRTRRYHSLLTHAMAPPGRRITLVNGIEAWVESGGKRFWLTSQKYAPDCVHPDGASGVFAFRVDPWPQWSYCLENGLEIEFGIVLCPKRPETILFWRFMGEPGDTSLHVRPLLSGRNHHSLHHENPDFQFEPQQREGAVQWTPYTGVPAITALSNGVYRHEPDWYRGFVYDEDQERGLDCVEDLASPGVFDWSAAPDLACLILRAGEQGAEGGADPASILEYAKQTLSVEESSRRSHYSGLYRAADAYIVRRGEGKTIVAGYPWFSDWGRDTFIAMRGLAIETGRLDVARDILVEWAGTLSEGMLPNQFPGNGDLPDYNSVDAALWYVIAAHDFMEAARAASMAGLDEVEPRIRNAMADIVEGYSAGTRRGIQLQEDGLLAAGDAGSQLTWMDAKVDGLACTPRVGKPVEIQALWINALHIAAARDPKWKATLHKAKSSFDKRFWNDDHNYLNDVVDVGHQADTVDDSFRPNQILAVGGLPFEVLDAAKCRSVVDAVEAQLWTPMGLRSLAPGQRGYCPKYEGGMASRDRAYHQGTVWPWLIGPFVEAWVRVHGDGKAELREARERFVDPLIRRMTDQGIGHVSEIADAEPPYTPRGNPFQAWSLSELIRAVRLVGRGSYTPDPDLDLATTNAAVNC